MSQPVFIYAALCALMLVGLSAYVIRARQTMRIGLGDGGNPKMLQRMRMHANFVEYVPMALLMIYFVQQAGYSNLMVHALGSVLIISRVAHIVGLQGSSSVSVGRMIGVVGTFGVIVFSAALLLQVSFAPHP